MKMEGFAVITVSKDGSGDFDSVQNAVNAALAGETVYVKNGVYRERVEVCRPNITIEGESAENTVLEYGLYAKMMLNGTEKLGTFRSYTMLINTDNFTCRRITVSNTAGFGTYVGQAVAVYAEGDNITFEECHMLGHQDTLFTGPLPYKEYEKGGFCGPTEFAERRKVRQYYFNCYIEGEVDFIFGSAAAYFQNCELHSLDRGMAVNGFVTAASTYEGMKYGYVFDSCRFTGNCPDGTVYLGRPWRNHAKTVLINCDIGAHINPSGFHDWDKTEARDTVFYAEYGCRGKGYTPQKRAAFVRSLSDTEAAEYTLERFREL